MDFIEGPRSTREINILTDLKELYGTSMFPWAGKHKMKENLLERPGRNSENNIKIYIKVA